MKSEMLPGSIEVPAQVAFFAAYGAALFTSNQLHFWCARLDADTFDDLRHGSRIRAEEKHHDALEATFGRVKDNLHGRIPKALFDWLDAAVSWRNYVSHRLPWDSRELQHDDGLVALASSLNICTSWFVQLCDDVRHHYESLLHSKGFDAETVASWMGPWNELGAPPTFRKLTPPKHVLVRKAWWGRLGAIGNVFFETADAVLYRFVDNGLGLYEGTIGDSWTPWHEGAHLFPASLSTRPTRKSGALRGSFDYDLELSTGCVLRCENARGGAGFSIDVLEARVPKTRS